jgi:exodeoxyribonuclease V alpha subunit
MSAMSPVDALLQIGALRVVDHALTQSLLRLRADTPAPVLLAAALCSRALAQGHSRLPLTRATELLLEVAPDGIWPELPMPDDWLAVLRASPWVSAMPAAGAHLGAIAGDADEEPVAIRCAPTTGSVLVLEDDAISLRRYWLHEVRLAAALQLRLSCAAVAPEDVAQARAAGIALASRLLLLTGGPGTGKTRTVATILKLLAEHAQASEKALRIALAAPTGKAAARLAEAVRDSDATWSSSAQTLHRLLGLSGDGRPPRFDAAHPLPFDVVVVDEASMVDLPMMARLVDAVPAQALLVLLGDPDQLPSVEAGAVLGALCEAHSSAALAARHVHLERSHRQTATLDIAPLTAAIRRGDGDAAIVLFERSAGLDWQRGGDAALAAFVREHAVAQYRRVQRCADLAGALAEAKNFRVLTALRDGPAGSQTLNALIARQLHPETGAFFTGRLILITENSYRHGLFNGDIGLCWPDAEGILRVWFEGDGRGDPAHMAGPRAWHPAQLPAHESAFALTVHKAQGSEFSRILLALPEHDARVISRELLYTGLSRGRAGIALWACEPVLRAAIARKTARWNGLAARLR